MSLHIIVIGAGLAGLSVAISTKLANPSHCVTVLESARELAEIGAGLQFTPNSTRLCKQWGIFDCLCEKATPHNVMSVRRYDGTKLLAHEPDFQKKIVEKYHAPLWGIYRVDVQRAMATRCEELGVELRFGCKVSTVDFSHSSVTIEGGEQVNGDVILCTDGIWSSIRSQFLRQPSPALPTGDLAYRILIRTASLTGADAPALRKFITDANFSLWIGPNSHVVSYTLRAGELFNVVLLCPDNLPAAVTKTSGDIEEMKALFQGWDPLLLKFLAQVKEVAKWKLMHLDPLPQWANEQGTFLMAGDSCHPMLPYLAQGANSSLEDGAVLGFLLGKVGFESRVEQLPKLARLYQELRKERGELIQKEAFGQREAFHLQDGEEQEERDRIMTAMLGKEIKEGFPSRWTCPKVQAWLYSYDSYKEAEQAFAKDPF